MFSKAIIAILAASAVSAAPAAVLQPWEITTLYTHSPSGRPGNDPHSTLNATINDPNTLPITQTPTGTAVFPPSTANCSAQWLTEADVPWNVAQPCTAIDYGTWTMTMVPGSGDAGTGATTDFGLVFKLVDSVRVLNQQYTRTFKGKGQFKVGTNLSGQCGGSGVCNWGLTTTPYAIKQKEVK
ncbi:hypothetical protein K505DRAFT_421767 [Melanomma pulvis-pyrius CBS 109.77]|uniref:Cell death in tomato 1 n=1 Tax=Melanomma pulvis-pyrius CBS 109.77 TaxID=1314802 RepID=A0A6A6WUC2_9PLEO|nr:hypothetical protein K505DRAFT_421767 [Melanomma pulvis-pyrius CBS 109.77]